MPRTRVCAEPGCPELTTTSRCPAHRRPRTDRRRKPRDAYHHTEAWKRTSAAKRRTTPLCERCGRPAHDVHHRDGNTRNLDPANLESLCRRCHNRETHGRAGAPGG